MTWLDEPTQPDGGMKSTVLKNVLVFTLTLSEVILLVYKYYVISIYYLDTIIISLLRHLHCARFVALPTTFTRLGLHLMTAVSKIFKFVRPSRHKQANLNIVFVMAVTS